MVGNLIALALAGTVVAVVASTRRTGPSAEERRAVLCPIHRQVADYINAQTVEQIIAEWGDPERANIGLHQAMNSALADGCDEAVKIIQTKLTALVTRPRTIGR